MRASLVGREATRYTPTGLAVVESSFLFDGEVVEAGTARTLRFEFDALAIGEVAARLQRQALGTTVDLTGFVAPRSRRSRRLRVHITEYTESTGD